MKVKRIVANINTKDITAAKESWQHIKLLICIKPIGKLLRDENE